MGVQPRLAPVVIGAGYRKLAKVLRPAYQSVARRAVANFRRQWSGAMPNACLNAADR